MPWYDYEEDENLPRYEADSQITFKIFSDTLTAYLEDVSYLKDKAGDDLDWCKRKITGDVIKNNKKAKMVYQYATFLLHSDYNYQRDIQTCVQILDHEQYTWPQYNDSDYKIFVDYNQKLLNYFEKEEISDNCKRILIANVGILNSEKVSDVFEDARTSKRDYDEIMTICTKIINQGHERPKFNLDNGETFESFTGRLNEYVQMLELGNYYKREFACRTIENNGDVTRVLEDAKTCGTDYNIFIKICIEIIDKGYKRPIFDLDTGETFESFTDRLKE